MKEPMVSIVIPVYNRENIILDTLKSATEQTYRNIEIIVVDNCSTDNTFEVCKNYNKVDSRIKLYQNDKNIGPVRNWIQGISKAKGEYIKILWSDDWIDHNYIEECMKLMKENVAFVFTPAKITYLDNQEKSFIDYRIYSKNKMINKTDFIEKSIIRDFNYSLPVSPGCALFRKVDLEKNTLVEIENNEGLIFNRYGAGNDLLMFLLTAINSNYTKVGFCNETLAYFRAHEGSFSISNDLSKYYDYSKVYFLNFFNDKEIANKFKSILFLRKIKRKDYMSLYNYLDANLNIIEICKYVINYYKMKIK